MPQTGKTRIATPQTRYPTAQTRCACPLHPHATAQPFNIVRAASTPPQPPARARRRGPITHTLCGCRWRRCTTQGVAPARHRRLRRRFQRVARCAVLCRASRARSGHWYQRPPPKRARRRELRGVSCVGTAHMMCRRSNPWRRRTSAVPPPVHAGRAAPRRADRPLSTGARARARADCGVRARALATAPRIAPSTAPRRHRGPPCGSAEKRTRRLRVRTRYVVRRPVYTCARNK